jgi:hypothetical protein
MTKVYGCDFAPQKKANTLMYKYHAQQAAAPAASPL